MARKVIPGVFECKNVVGGCPFAIEKVQFPRSGRCPGCNNRLWQVTVPLGVRDLPIPHREQNG